MLKFHGTVPIRLLDILWSKLTIRPEDGESINVMGSYSREHECAVSN